MNGAGERKVRVGLTIAGSDPSGGAGIQADLKTFHQFDVYGASVITLLTVQNSLGVQEVQILEPRFVVAQLRAVLDDIRPHAAKTGALGNEAVIRAVAAGRQRAAPASHGDQHKCDAGAENSREG